MLISWLGLVTGTTLSCTVTLTWMSCVVHVSAVFMDIQVVFLSHSTFLPALSIPPESLVSSWMTFPLANVFLGRSRGWCCFDVDTAFVQFAYSKQYSAFQCKIIILGFIFYLCVGQLLPFPMKETSSRKGGSSEARIPALHLPPGSWQDEDHFCRFSLHVSLGWDCICCGWLECEVWLDTSDFSTSGLSQGNLPLAHGRYILPCQQRGDCFLGSHGSL